MFAHTGSVIGLWPGERPEDSGDDLAFELTCRELADGWVNPERDLLPNNLEDLLSGPYLAAIVSAVDPGRLNGHDAVRLMRARARLSSHNEAGKLRAMAEVALSPPGDADSPVERDFTEIEYVAAEIAAGLALTRRSSETELSRALSLNGRLRRVWSALSAAAIDLAKAKVFDQALGHLPDDTVNTVLDQIIAESGELTIGQLRARLSRLVLAADPDGSASAFQEGLSDRGVATYANPDQTGSFLIHNSNPTDIAAARSHVEEIARSLKTADESRTLEEIRADVALDLLQGKCLHKREARSAGRTNLQVSAETLLGWSDAPGDLEGYGPVLAEIARKTAVENVDGEWSFVVTDNGRPVATGTLSRRPTASQRRHLEAIYPTCVFPGCRRPSFDCDLDHRKPFSQGGPTHNDNLGPLCRHHHMVAITLRGNSSDFPEVTTSGPVHLGTPMSGNGRRPDDMGMLPTHSPYVATRPFTIKTPSSARRLAWPASTGVRSLPPVPTTRHQGSPSLLLSSVPTARAAPGKPASAATSP